LLYAATIDFGDADIANTLLAAGADPNVKNKEQDGLGASP
jgi:hypothetical protein